MDAGKSKAINYISIIIILIQKQISTRSLAMAAMPELDVEHGGLRDEPEPAIRLRFLRS